jgi:serine/threonine protein kinase
MRTGATHGRFVIGPQIGQGSFGKIFAARDSETGLIYAIKYESATAERKTLAFETKILARIQTCPYVPRLFESGETNSLAWVVMELIGPSLSSVLVRLPQHKLTLSSTLRVARHSLRALHALHDLGFIHRDLKPANLLIRLSQDPLRPPVCLIDFGLARIFRDQKSGQHERPRQRAGFRGTKTYASLNAHALSDLSRRDDLISWFYVILDIGAANLPWKGLSDAANITEMKNQFDIREAVEELSPRLFDIWRHIAALRFEGDPDYGFILSVIDEICEGAGVRDDDPYDWAEFVEQYRNTLAGEFGVALRIDGGSEILPYYSELGVPPVIMQQIDNRRSVLKSPLIRSGARNYSVMQASEMNEDDERGCCC